MSESKVVYVNDDYDSDVDDVIYGATTNSKEEKVNEQVNEKITEEVVEQKQDEEVVEEVVEQKQDEEVVEEVVEQKQDEEVEDDMNFIGGNGYKSDPDDNSSVSSLDTDAILNVDPLYFRLTKFLQTGGEQPENVAEILKKINTNLERMNDNLLNLMNSKSTQG